MDLIEPSGLPEPVENEPGRVGKARMQELAAMMGGLTTQAQGGTQGGVAPSRSTLPAISPVSFEPQHAPLTAPLVAPPPRTLPLSAYDVRPAPEGVATGAPANLTSLAMRAWHESQAFAEDPYGADEDDYDDEYSYADEYLEPAPYDFGDASFADYEGAPYADAGYDEFDDFDAEEVFDAGPRSYHLEAAGLGRHLPRAEQPQPQSSSPSGSVWGRATSLFPVMQAFPIKPKRCACPGKKMSTGSCGCSGASYGG